ncbi:hypothetical protein HDU98_006436 [Podochytrium sp. JEL0797]|nr:hypothetical protein HDU98_006436 [Podochytrium sp. JEL0797]
MLTHQLIALVIAASTVTAVPLKCPPKYQQPLAAAAPMAAAPEPVNAAVQVTAPVQAAPVALAVPPSDIVAALASAAQQAPPQATAAVAQIQLPQPSVQDAPAPAPQQDLAAPAPAPQQEVAAPAPAPQPQPQVVAAPAPAPQPQVLAAPAPAPQANVQATGVVDCTKVYQGFVKTGNDQTDILNLHNVVRRNVNAMLNNPAMPIGQLTWSDALAATAQQIGQQSPADVCSNTHTGDPGQNYDWMSWKNTPGDMLRAGEDWIAGDVTNPGTNVQTGTPSECSNYPNRMALGGMNNLDAWGHYTQAIWPTTTQIGCVSVDCAAYGGGQNIVCEYLPRGNVIMQGASDFIYTF